MNTTYLFTQTPLKFLIEPLWRDEAFSYLLAKRNIFELLVLTARDFNPPLYYVLLKVWMFIFGTSEIALRSLSLLFFMATIYVADHIFQDIFKLTLKRRWIYLVLLLLNPILLYYAFEARMYSMLAFFAAASFYSFYTKKKKLFFYTTLFGLFTHYFMLFVIATEVIYAVAGNRFRRGKRTRSIHEYDLRDSMKPLFYFAPWLAITLFVKQFGAAAFWIDKTKLGELSFLPGILYTGYEKNFDFYPRTPDIYPPIIFYFSLTIIFLIILGFVWRRSEHSKSNDNLFVFLFFWAFLGPCFIFFLSFVKPLFLPRYLIYASVGLVILLAYCIDKLPQLARIIVIVFLLLFTWNYQKLQVKYRHKKYPAEKIKEIKSYMLPQDKLYLTNELDYFVGQYYIGENRVSIYQKPYDEVPMYVGKVLMPQSVFTNTLPTYPTRAFVLQPDGSYSIQSIR